MGDVTTNSAGDWGKSDPLAVPEMILEMRRRCHAEEMIRKVVYDNPLSFFKLSNRWQDFASPADAPRKNATQGRTGVKV